MRAAIRRACQSVGARGMVLAVALIAAGCAGTPDAPKWLTGGEPHDYPQKQYVSGVGSGGDPDAAASAARAEIARKTKGESEGVEIAKTYVAKTPPAHWALAVLDRPALLARLTEEIGATEQQLSQALAASSNASPEEALDPMLGAIMLAQRRDALLTRIVNLGGTPPASEASHSRAALDLQLASIKRALAIDVQAYEMDSQSGMMGAPLDEVRRALAQQVLAKGFALPAESDWGDSPGWLVARARIAFEPLELDRSHDFVAVHWEAALEIEDRAAGGQVVAVLTEESRATHLNEREARRQAQEQAETFLAAALASWLDERYASGAVIPVGGWTGRESRGLRLRDGDRATEEGQTQPEKDQSEDGDDHEVAPDDAEPRAPEQDAL